MSSSLNDNVGQLLSTLKKIGPDLNCFFKVMKGDLSLNRHSTNQSNIVRNPLKTQCKVTSDLINFIFNSNDSNENITEETIYYQTDHNLQFYMNKIKSKIQAMESESNPCFLNFSISVYSISNNYCGHKFNCFCVKDGENTPIKFYLLQSFVVKYSFQYQEKSKENLLNQLEDFLSVFLSDNEQTQFTSQNVKKVQTFTFIPPEIGNSKPTDIGDVSFYYERNINPSEFLERKLQNINTLLYQTKRTGKLFYFLNKLLKESFGFNHSRESTDKKISYITQILEKTREIKNSMSSTNIENTYLPS